MAQKVENIYGYSYRQTMDLCRATLRLAKRVRDDPEVRARYAAWLAKRQAAENKQEARDG